MIYILNSKGLKFSCDAPSPDRIYWHLVPSCSPLKPPATLKVLTTTTLKSRQAWKRGTPHNWLISRRWRFSWRSLLSWSRQKPFFSSSLPPSFLACHISPPIELSMQIKFPWKMALAVVAIVQSRFARRQRNKAGFFTTIVADKYLGLCR